MKVLIADKFADTGIEALRGLGCGVDCNPDLKGDALTQAVKDANCQVLIVRSTKVDRAALEAGENLKLIIRAGSGFDTIDFEGAAELDIRVCNCPGMNSVAVAELTIRDVTKDVALMFTLVGKARLDGRLTIKRLDFGLGEGEWADTAWIGDEVTVMVQVVNDLDAGD